MSNKNLTIKVIPYDIKNYPQFDYSHFRPEIQSYINIFYTKQID